MSVTSALTPPRLSDEQLLARLADGDRSAGEELFQRYRLMAYRVAHRFLGNESDALDATQNGFVKALTKLGGFQGRSSFKTWLLRVVTNAALDLGRQRSRREVHSQDAFRSTHDGSAVAKEDPGSGLERQDLRHALDRALASLPETQRRTFVLHADADLSYREVAEVMGVSIGTVMSRLYYARQKLRASLAHWIQL